MSDELKSDEVTFEQEDAVAEVVAEVTDDAGVLEESAPAEPDVGAPVHSLMEPGDEGLRSSILDSVLHPEDEEGTKQEKLDRKN